jgi:hypothetical protein
VPALTTAVALVLPQVIFVALALHVTPVGTPGFNVGELIAEIAVIE